MHPHSPAVLVLAALVSAAAAHARPAPEPRRLAAARGPAPFAGAPADALGGRCATSIDGVGAALAEAAARPAVAPLPTSHSTDADGIAVLEDDGSFLYTNRDGRTLVDIAAVGHAFYRTHGDDYDQLAVYLASDLSEWLGSPGALAAAWVVRNDTQGIGLTNFDQGELLGSPARLQSFLTMNSLAIYPDDPDAIVAAGDVFSTMGVLAHEFAHRWLAYTLVDSAGRPSAALLGRDYQHWSFFFDSDSSFMEGCDWDSLPPDSFVTDGSASTFGQVDQYLMGLRSPAEMTPFFTLTAPQDFQPPGTYFPGAVPFVGIGCRAVPRFWSVNDIVRRNGPRSPAAGVAPTHWRVGFVLLVPNGEAASAADLAKLQVIRTRFPDVFAKATWMRGSVDVSLDSHAGTVRLAHARHPDIEDGASPIRMGVRAWIDPAGIPLALDPSSLALHWRGGTSGAFSALPLAPAGPDSFAVTSLPPALSGVVQYWFSAASDSAGIGAQLPAAGAGAPFEFHVGPDAQPPVVVHVPMNFQSPARIPQPLVATVNDNLGVDSVWVESAIGGGAVVRSAATPAGPGLWSWNAVAGPGQRLAYRFVARDASVAGNVGFSNPAFDTLRMVHDAFDDFENPSPTFAHSPVLWSGRDPWEIDASDSSPPGGLAWHAGNADGSAYEPHCDAALLLPWIYDAVPGTHVVFDERHDLEADFLDGAYDAAVVEVHSGSGPWVPAEPSPGYTHTMLPGGPFLQANVRVWSGASNGWVTRTLDLTPFLPGPVQVRVRMCSDDFVGAGGVWVDRVRVRYPDDAGVGVPSTTPSLAAGPPWPTPTRGALHVRLALPRTARVEWVLLDVQGRRAAALWSGTAPAGVRTLEADAGRTLSPGLYFSRLSVDGRALDARRVVLVR